MELLFLFFVSFPNTLISTELMERVSPIEKHLRSQSTICLQCSAKNAVHLLQLTKDHYTEHTKRSNLTRLLSRYGITYPEILTLT